MNIPAHVLANEPLDVWLTSVAEDGPSNDGPSNEMVRYVVRWASIELWWRAQPESDA